MRTNENQPEPESGFIGGISLFVYDRENHLFNLQPPILISPQQVEKVLEILGG
jgi:hypothetical protein